MKINLKSRLIKKLTLATVLFFFVSVAVAQHSAPWNAPESAKDKKNPFAANESSLERGAKSYRIDCMRCHGKAGKGDGPSAMKIDKTVADLSSAKVQNQTDGELFWKISEGRKPMPLAKRILTDDQRWDIINYIRTFKSK